MGDWMSRAFADIETETNNAVGVAGLRAAMMKDGKLDKIEAQRLIALHKSGESPANGDGWTAFLIEAITDYFALSREVPMYDADELKPNWRRAIYSVADAMLVDALPDQVAEASYTQRLEKMAVEESDSDALIDAISANGMVLDSTEIKLLAALFARAVTYPKAFRAFAWEALKATILADSKIGDDEVNLARAMVMGPASLEGVAVNTDEAEAICEMDARVDDNHKADAWYVFTAQALGSHLLYAGGTPGRLDHQEKAWLDTKLAMLSAKSGDALKAFIAKWDGQ